MFIIISILLLLTTSYLFPMEALNIEPSNSSSEICFFIKNIDHNLSQHQLPEDLKKTFLTKYIAITNNERIASNDYSILINEADYMHLQKNNKFIIQTLHTQNSISIHTSNNTKQIFLDNYPEAHTLYQKMLELPRDIRCKIANKYSSMILVKTREANHVAEQLNNIVTFGIPASLGNFLSSTSFSYILMETLYNRTNQFPKEFENYYNKGYESLPLVPENDKTDK